MPGEGDLPVVDFMRAVSATGYDRVISLEIFNYQFRAANSRAVAVDGQRSLLNLMDQVRRAEPQLSFTLPPPVAVEQIEFVEFTTDEESAAPLVAMLRTMGFRRTGQHKTKDVERYQQGGISIVVNTDRAGLAHSTYLTRGLSAYAFGVRVPDAKEALARAKALGAAPFMQDVGDGEIPCPPFVAWAAASSTFSMTVPNCHRCGKKSLSPWMRMVPIPHRPLGASST